MGKNGQNTITDVAYRPWLSVPLGMDVVDFAELRERGRRREIDLSDPQRPDFHHLIRIDADGDPLRHTVDFATHVIPPGGWLWVGPGRVHQFAADEVLERTRGTIVIWRPGFVTTDMPGQLPLTPEGTDRELAELALRHLLAEYRHFGTLHLEAHNTTLRMLLSVLLVRLANASGPATPETPTDGPFARFRAAVERDFATSHRVADYAAALGYSTRTLTRAALQATGTTAKAYLDARIVLEAKRLLVHTDAPAADVARHLGFRSGGDFAKFFRSRDGRTPLTFRDEARGRDPAAWPPSTDR